jgi:hypothetical protein
LRLFLGLRPGFRGLLAQSALTTALSALVGLLGAPCLLLTWRLWHLRGAGLSELLLSWRTAVFARLQGVRARRLPWLRLLPGLSRLRRTSLLLARRPGSFLTGLASLTGILVFLLLLAWLLSFRGSPLLLFACAWSLLLSRLLPLSGRSAGLSTRLLAGIAPLARFFCLLAVLAGLATLLRFARRLLLSFLLPLWPVRTRPLLRLCLSALRLLLFLTGIAGRFSSGILWAVRLGLSGLRGALALLAGWLLPSSGLIRLIPILLRT